MKAPHRRHTGGGMGGEGAETAGGRVVGAIAATRGSEGGAGPASAVLPDDRHLPQQRSVYLQMCDLKGEEIKALVHEVGISPPTPSSAAQLVLGLVHPAAALPRA